MRKFLIYVPPYSEKYGGIISAHNLCDLINRLGGEAYVHPWMDVIEANALNIGEAIELAQRQRAMYETDIIKGGYAVRDGLLTPVRHVFDDGEYGDDWIVVYPEITFGNPLRARNIVRWLLHNPGFHSGRIGYGPNEFHIRFSRDFQEFHFPWCTLSENVLTVMSVNFDLYNTENVAENRSGSAYCVRKGAGKRAQHDLTNSILIDDMSQAEIAQVFKSVKTFYSYDTRTTYLHLAVLCGCDSVVIPDDGVTETEWQPDELLRSGIAYGEENIEEARRTAYRVKPLLEELEKRSAEHTLSFMHEADSFFNQRS